MSLITKVTVNQHFVFGCFKKNENFVPRNNYVL